MNGRWAATPPHGQPCWRRVSSFSTRNVSGLNRVVVSRPVTQEWLKPCLAIRLQVWPTLAELVVMIAELSATRIRLLRMAMPDLHRLGHQLLS